MLRPGGPPSSTIDELTTWTRELSASEIAALFASQRTIREACKL
jgi:hypothetical protein